MRDKYIFLPGKQLFILACPLSKGQGNTSANYLSQKKTFTKICPWQANVASCLSKVANHEIIFFFN